MMLTWLHLTFFSCFDFRPVETPDKDKNTDIKADVKRRGQTLPTTDADMIRAGSSFLDAIEKSLGLR
jgi:hypothetical protein